MCIFAVTDVFVLRYGISFVDSKQSCVSREEKGWSEEENGIVIFTY